MCPKTKNTNRQAMNTNAQPHDVPVSLRTPFLKRSFTSRAGWGAPLEPPTGTPFFLGANPPNVQLRHGVPGRRPRMRERVRLRQPRRGYPMGGNPNGPNSGLDEVGGDWGVATRSFRESQTNKLRTKSRVPSGAPLWKDKWSKTCQTSLGSSRFEGPICSSALVSPSWKHIQAIF